MTQLDRDIRISTVGRDDYPELEGKIVKVTGYSKAPGGILEGIVVGCNRSVGCTIVNVEDKDQVIVCFAGPVSPGGIKPPNMLGRLKANNKTYDDLFDEVIRLIELGEWEAGAVTKFMDGHYSYGGCNLGYCAYTQ